MQVRLPSLLRRIYVEAANGEFGPGREILGLRDGWSDSDKEILNAAWRLQTADSMLVGSQDNLGAVRPGLERLVGSPVTGTSVSAPFLDVAVRFGGVELRLFPSAARDDGADRFWCVKLPSGDVMCAGPGRTVQTIAAGEPRW